MPLAETDAEPPLLKDRLGPPQVRRLAARAEAVVPGFDAPAFVRDALGQDGATLDTVQLNERVTHLADALRRLLPEDPAERTRALVALAVAPGDAVGAWRGDRGGAAAGAADATAPLSGFLVWPLTDVLARHTLDAPDAAFDAMHALTQRFTAELCLRPYWRADRERVLTRLRAWVDDPSGHVRRLVSEGTRPRLPWGGHLRDLLADPAPTLPLLEALRDDPSEYVRRSVANHLNEISKDHPDVAAAVTPRRPPPTAHPTRAARAGSARRRPPRPLAAGSPLARRPRG